MSGKIKEGFYRYINVFLFFLWLIVDRIYYMEKLDSRIFLILMPFIFYLCYSLVKVEKMEKDIQILKDRLKGLDQ